MNNFLKKAADLFGFSEERVSKMTAEEQKKLESYGQQAEGLEKAKADAEAQRDNAIAERDAKDKDLQAANARITELEKSIKDKDATISSLQKDVAERDATIAALPGAPPTTVVKEEDPEPPRSEEEEKPRFHTSADAELAAMRAKFHTTI